MSNAVQEIDEFTATAGSNNKSFEPTPAGLIVARCFSVIILGTFLESFGNEAPKPKEKIRLSFELPTELHEYKEGEGMKPRVISKEYTFSIHEKASFRKDIENWRGQQFTAEEAQAFSAIKLLGVPCMLNIIHKNKTNEAGQVNTYASVSSISPMPKGYSCPAHINENFTFSVRKFNQGKYNSLPEWLKEKISKSKEYIAAGLPPYVAPATTNNQTTTPSFVAASAPAASQAPAAPAPAPVAPQAPAGSIPSSRIEEPADLPF